MLFRARSIAKIQNAPRQVQRRPIGLMAAGLVMGGGLGGILLPMVGNELTPAAWAALSKPSKQAYQIAPGKVGYITPQTTKASLAKRFPVARLEDFTAYGPEGIGEFAATRVTQNGEHMLDVLWKNANRQQADRVRIYDDRWRTAEGVGINTSLNELQRLFGVYKFYGFGWDYSGRLVAGNSKLDKYTKNLGMVISMNADSQKSQRNNRDYQALMGDRKIASNDARARRLNIRISYLEVSFIGTEYE
jgi:hypothetical protein